jgi:hypothetical protein
MKERSMSSSPSGPSGAFALLLAALAFECINFVVGLQNGIGTAILQAVLAGFLAVAAFAIWHVIVGSPGVSKDPKCI